MRRGLAALVSVAIVATGLIALGAAPAGAVDTTKTVTPNTPPIVAANVLAGDNIRVKFQGLAGQVVSVATTLGTFANNCDANLSILKPDGITLQAGPVCGGIAGAINSVTLPTSGLYQAFVDPAGVLVGSVKVAVTSTAAISSITANAAAVSVTVPAAGTVNLGFQGTLNKYVAVKAIGDGICSSTYKVVKPDTTDLIGATCATAGPAGSFTDQTTLPATGVYNVRLVNTSGAAKVVKVQIWVNTNKTGAIVLDGPAVTTAVLAVAQNETRTFSGTNGAIVTIDLTASTLASYCVYLNRPDGSSLVGNCYGTGTGFFAATTLDVTGTWKIVIDPNSTYAGKVTVELNTATVSPGTIVVDGPTKTATIATAGSTVQWTFSATLGQKITTKITNSTLADTYVSIKRPDNSVADSHYVYLSDHFFDPFTVDVAGTWKILIDPNGTETGAMTVKLATAPDVTGAITLGTAQAITIPKAGQIARYTFTGALNQRITTKVTGNTFVSGSTLVYFYRPDGSQFTGFYASAPTAWYDPIVLDVAGTWTVEIDPYQEETGSLSLTLRSVTDITGPITLATPKAVAITQAGQRARYTFTGALNQRITSKVTGNTLTSGNTLVYFYRPDGSQYAGFYPAAPDSWYDPVALDVAGTWTVEIDPYTEETGSLSLTLRSVTDLTGTITLGTPKAVAITQAGQRARYTFTGALNQRITSKVTGNTLTSGSTLVYFYRPDGSQFTGFYASAPTAWYDPIVLDAAGTWTVEIDPYAEETGNLSLTLRSVTDLTGAITLATPKAVAITQAGQRARYTFTRNNGQTFKATLTGSTLTSGNTLLNFYRPDGSAYSACYFGGGTTVCPLETADASGTWTVEIDPYQEEIGNVTLNVTAT